MRQSKVCTKCGELKPLTAYYPMKGMRDGHRNDCIECNKAAKRVRQAAYPEPYRERSREWNKNNPERRRAYQAEYRKRPEVQRRARDTYYRKTYGKTAAEVDDIVELQGGCCLICRVELPERLGSRHLDHDHVTGQIRGVLCIDCNHGLGKFRDSSDLLLRALVYLREGGFLELLKAV